MGVVTFYLRELEQVFLPQYLSNSQNGFEPLSPRTSPSVLAVKLLTNSSSYYSEELHRSVLGDQPHIC